MQKADPIEVESVTSGQVTGSKTQAINAPQSGITSEAKPWLWRNGQSGNPKGRPKSSFDLAKRIKELLYSKHPDRAKLTAYAGREIKTRLDVLLLRLEKEDPKTVLAYGFGKPLETHLVAGQVNGVVEFKINIPADKLP